MKTNRFIHVIYAILGSGSLLLTTAPSSFANSLPACLGIINQDVNSITVRNDCNKTVQYNVVSPTALAPCKSIRPGEVQTTKLPRILGIRSC
jgi:hypothetical protein